MVLGYLADRAARVRREAVIAAGRSYGIAAAFLGEEDSTTQATLGFFQDALDDYVDVRAVDRRGVEESGRPRGAHIPEIAGSNPAPATTTFTATREVSIGATPTLVRLPGLTALFIDPERRVVAIDLISGVTEALSPEWTLVDLRDGIYGEFHRLLPANQCFDPPGCAKHGQHVDPVGGPRP